MLYGGGKMLNGDQGALRGSLYGNTQTNLIARTNQITSGS